MTLTKKITVTALFSVMVAGLTIFVAVPIFIGYLNIGDALIMLLATVLPAPMMFVIGGVGSGLADFALGYPQYIIFTVLIKGSEGVLVSYLYRTLEGTMKRVVPFIAGGLWITLAYGLTDVFLTQSWAYFIPSASYNIIQGMGCALIAIALAPGFSSMMRKLLNK
jgi:uncharacterized membrane protein